MRRLPAIVVPLCLLFGALPVLMMAGAADAHAAVGTVYGTYTVTNTITSGAITGSSTAANAPVYEVTGTSTTPITMSSGYAVIVLNGISRTTTTSPLQLTGTAHATVYLAGTSTNTFTCTGISNAASTTTHQAGIYVSLNATLTIEGTGTLTANGGRYAAGIGGSYSAASYTGDVTTDPNANGTIIMTSGNVTATGGIGGAGVGGGLNGNGGYITINGGTLNATGGAAASGTGVTGGGGAGIGGGGNIGQSTAGSTGMSTGNQASWAGYITINGGNVTAKSMIGSAGIGGGFWSGDGFITINGGTVNAQAASGGTGIGAGGRSTCGQLAITGGTITATGSSQAAGIGNGTGVTGCNITISGGTIWATSAVSNASGIGGGADTSGNPGSATVVITSGNVYSGNSQGYIRVNTNPTNGSAHGSQSVYAIDVTLENSSGGVMPNTGLSIYVTGVTSGYTYTATTDASGHAYIWLPAGDYPVLMTDPVAGTYSDYLLVVTNPGTGAYTAVTETIQMVVNSPAWSWAEADTVDKLYGTGELDLAIDHNNPCTNSGTAQVAVCQGKAIAGVAWFRESVANPVNTIDTFNAGFTAASSGDSGTGTSGNATDALNLQAGATADVQNFTMQATRNGRYWVQVHFIAVNTGLDVYFVKSVDVANVYTPVSVQVRDWNLSANAQAKAYTALPPPPRPRRTASRSTWTGASWPAPGPRSATTR